jgi:hypothetical protein
MKYEKNKTHNMLSLMLDPRFKSLWLVSSIIGQEHGISIAEKLKQMILVSNVFEMPPNFTPYGRIWSYGRYGD